MTTDWDDYERRVQELEAQGITRSDAQAIVDAYDLKKEQRKAIIFDHVRIIQGKEDQ